MAIKDGSSFVTTIQNNPWYALSLLLLACISLSLLIYEISPWSKSEIVAVNTKLDLVIAYIFLTDFFLGLLLNKKYTYRQYWRQNWLDFIASIPISSEIARSLRILRLVRALRIISVAVNLYLARRQRSSRRKS